MGFLDTLGFKPRPSQAEGDRDTIRRIMERLDSLDPALAKRHALFACILSRVANVDSHISEEETRAMEDLLIRLGHLTPDVAGLVLEIAKAQNKLFGGVENFLFTREFLKISSAQEREHLLECLFAVASADQSISSLESDEIRVIASELKIEHADFIAIRSRFREHLAVLKA